MRFCCRFGKIYPVSREGPVAESVYAHALRACEIISRVGSSPTWPTSAEQNCLNV